MSDEQPVENVMTVYCDGSITGPNPGGHGYTGWVIYTTMCGIVHKHSDDLGSYPKMSNNVAEYGALISVLNYLKLFQMTTLKVTLRTDSQLVVRQLTGEYQCHQPHLLMLRDSVLRLSKIFPKGITFEWIPREENTVADEMSKSLWKCASPE